MNQLPQVVDKQDILSLYDLYAHSCFSVASIEISSVLGEKQQTYLRKNESNLDYYLPTYTFKNLPALYVKHKRWVPYLRKNRYLRVPA